MVYCSGVEIWKEVLSKKSKNEEKKGDVTVEFITLLGP